MDLKGNACALIIENHAPCQMESVQHKMPDWDECPYNPGGVRLSLDEAVSQLRIYPQEFWPLNAIEWEGISFKDWLDFLNKVHGRNF